MNKTIDWFKVVTGVICLIVVPIIAGIISIDTQRQQLSDTTGTLAPASEAFVSGLLVGFLAGAFWFVIILLIRAIIRRSIGRHA